MWTCEGYWLSRFVVVYWFVWRLHFFWLVVCGLCRLFVWLFACVSFFVVVRVWVFSCCCKCFFFFVGVCFFFVGFVVVFGCFGVCYVFYYLLIFSLMLCSCVLPVSVFSCRFFCLKLLCLWGVSVALVLLWSHL